MNIETLRSLKKLLFEGTSLDRCSKVIRGDLFDQIITSDQTEKSVRTSVEWAFSTIAANNLKTHPMLVADVVKAWEVAYPGKSSIVLDTILNEAYQYIDGAGEGLAIGLMEIITARHDPVFESAVFRALSSNLVISAMLNSKPTSAGSGRLTTVIQSLTLSCWIKNSLNSRVRRIEITKLLSDWHCVLLARSSRYPRQRAESIDCFWDFSPSDEQTFLEKFADELSKRLFANTPLGLRFHLNSLLAQNLPTELTI